MKQLSFVAAIILASFAASPAAYGQTKIVEPVKEYKEDTAAALEDARAIMTATNVEKTMDTTFSQLIPVMASAFIGQISSSSEGIELLKSVDAKYPGGREAFGSRFGELMLSGIRSKYPEILSAASEVLVSEINPADLSAIRAFYQTPGGIRLVAAQPKLQQQLSDTGRKIGAQVGQDSATQLVKETKKYLSEAQ